MLPSIKNAGGAETKVLSKRELKKRINIRWNSGVFFQLGLVAILLLTYIVMESDWDLGARNKLDTKTRVTVDEPLFYNFTIEQPKVKTVAKLQKTVKPRVLQNMMIAAFEPISDDTDKIEAPIQPTDIPVIAVAGSGTASVKKDSKPSNINTVQFVPVFPGCESLSNNAERRACMSSKVNTFISRRFNSDKFSELESGKFHTVRVQFTIGKDGLVKDILARAQLPELEKEAKRVIGKMPIMKPGKQGNTEVDVLFTVPIKFQVQ